MLTDHGTLPGRPEAEAMKQFQDRKVLVTGASRGIGKCIAEAFAAQGARVAINYRANAAAATDCLRGLAGQGHIALQADIADAEQAERLVADAVKGLGGLDIVVNNAGIYLFHPVAWFLSATGRRPGGRLSIPT